MYYFILLVLKELKYIYINLNFIIIIIKFIKLYVFYKKKYNFLKIIKINLIYK